MAQEPTHRDIQLGCNYANACTESIQNIKKGVSRAALWVTEVVGMTVPFGQCWAVFDTKMIKSLFKNSDRCSLVEGWVRTVLMRQIVQVFHRLFILTFLTLTCQACPAYKSAKGERVKEKLVRQKLSALSDRFTPSGPFIIHVFRLTLQKWRRPKRNH